MSFEVTGEVIRQANVYGQIVEYHQVIHKRSANHIDNVMSATMLQSEMNKQLNRQGVDGWCDEVVVVQHVLTDDINFYGYVAATEPASPALVIPVWVVIAFIVAAAAVIMFGMWLVYDFFTGLAEKALPTNRYTTEEGETTTSFTEYITLQRKYYWLVDPEDGMGFASKSDYPTWESIPQEIFAAYEEHLAVSTPLVAPSYPWLVPVIIGGVVVIVVGSIWAVSQIFIRQEAPPITIYR